VKPPTATRGSLGDPERMRKSSGRGGFGVADPIGAHPLADGREAWVTWLHDSGTHCHVVVWIRVTSRREWSSTLPASTRQWRARRSCASWSLDPGGRGAPPSRAGTLCAPLAAAAPRGGLARCSFALTAGAGRGRTALLVSMRYSRVKVPVAGAYRAKQQRSRRFSAGRQPQLSAGSRVLDRAAWRSV
jgi:hypothetical protein